MWQWLIPSLARLDLTSRCAAWCLLLLQSLSLAYCYGLGNDTMSAIAKNCTELRSLSMQGMWNVTDEPFYELGGVRMAEFQHDQSAE